MARVQNIPGLFEQPQATGRGIGTSTRLGEIFELQPSGVDASEQTRIMDAIKRLEGAGPIAKKRRPIEEQIGKEFGIETGGFRGLGGGLKSQLESLLTAVPSPSEQIGLAAAERLGGPSIFEQMGIAGRAQELTQPLQLPTGFGGRTASEDALLQEIIGLTGGGSAARGLGAPSLGALGSQLAPALTQLRQQDIQNLFAGGQLGVQQLGALTGAAGVGGQERLGGIQGLLDLAGLTLPQPVVSQGGGGGTLGGTLTGAGTAAIGLSKLIPLLACHVAEELFGINDIRTHFARFYCATNDNPFIRTYRKMSRIWAKYLKDNPDKKNIVKPIWEAMALEGYKEYKRWQDDLLQ